MKIVLRRKEGGVAEETGPKKNGLLRIVVVAVALVLALLTIFALNVFYGPNTFGDEDSKVFYVSRGQSFATITDSLVAAGIVRDRSWFVFVAKIFGGTERMQVGKYMFTSGASNTDLFFSLREGAGIMTIPVLLPEGSRAKRYAALLARMIGTDSTRYMELVTDERFARSLGIGKRSLEGYLMPDTYFLTWQQDEESIIRTQVGEFWKFFGDSLRARSAEIGMSMHDVITLGSIVEGEIVLKEEAARVAGVYHNRLKKGMLLQADPTIQFFVSDGPRRLSYTDLKIDHPYNTYRRKGLPPGPVNNPGKAAILGTLYPESHRYYYFVADGKGGHRFSTSYSEHLGNVRSFRRDRARREKAEAATAK